MPKHKMFDENCYELAKYFTRDIEVTKREKKALAFAIQEAVDGWLENNTVCASIVGLK